MISEKKLEQLLSTLQNGNFYDAEILLNRLSPLQLALLRLKKDSEIATQSEMVSLSQIVTLPTKLILCETATSPTIATLHEIATLLDRPELNKYWSDKFHGLTDPFFEVRAKFREQEGMSKADFYCGHVLYRHAMTHKHEKYMKHAFYTFNSFHAASYHIYNLLIERLKDKDVEKSRTLDKYLVSEASRFLDFKTPGCLLLSVVFQQLGAIYSKQNQTKESRIAFQKAWLYLNLAEKFEESSTREIHNAYFGRGYKLSNPARLETLSELKLNLIDQAGTVLSRQTTDVLEKVANEIMKQHLDQLGPSEDMDFVESRVSSEPLQLTKRKLDFTTVEGAGHVIGISPDTFFKKTTDQRNAPDIQVEQEERDSSSSPPLTI